MEDLTPAGASVLIYLLISCQARKCIVGPWIAWLPVVNVVYLPFEWPPGMHPRSYPCTRTPGYRVLAPKPPPGSGTGINQTAAAAVAAPGRPLTSKRAQLSQKVVHAAGLSDINFPPQIFAHCQIRDPRSSKLELVTGNWQCRRRAAKEPL